MLQLLLAGLLAAAAGCGAAPPALTPLRPATPPVSATGREGLTGAYLSITIEPDEQLLNLARNLRRDLHFLDMGQALPPRQADVYHVTVAYFRSLQRHHASEMAQRFRGREATLELTGWGVAEGKAAYFAVSGIEGWRRELKAMGVDPFTADDPHITFGVNPGGRRDVHGVPKKAQHPLPPRTLHGRVSLKQGTRVLW